MHTCIITQIYIFSTIIYIYSYKLSHKDAFADTNVQASDACSQAAMPAGPGSIELQEEAISHVYIGL